METTTNKHQPFILADFGTGEELRESAKYTDAKGVHYGSKTWMRFVALRRAVSFKETIEKERGQKLIILFRQSPDDQHPRPINPRSVSRLTRLAQAGRKGESCQG